MYSPLIQKNFFLPLCSSTNTIQARAESAPGSPFFTSLFASPPPLVGDEDLGEFLMRHIAPGAGAPPRRSTAPTPPHPPWQPERTCCRQTAAERRAMSDERTSKTFEMSCIVGEITSACDPKSQGLRFASQTQEKRTILNGNKILFCIFSSSTSVHSELF